MKNIGSLPWFDFHPGRSMSHTITINVDVDTEQAVVDLARRLTAVLKVEQADTRNWAINAEARS